MNAPGLGKSDHDVRCNKLPENKKPLAYNIFKGDYVAIKNHLKVITWNEILNRDINDATGKFVTEMKNVMDPHIPLRRMSLQSRNIFMTPHCLKIKKQKKNLWNKYRTSGLARSLDAYKSCRNKLRSETRRLRGDFEGQIISNTKTRHSGSM